MIKNSKFEDLFRTSAVIATLTIIGISVSLIS